MCKRKIFCLLLLAVSVASSAATPFAIVRGKAVRLSMPQHRLPVLESAVAMFGGDVKAVFGDTLELVADNSDIDVRIDTAAVKSPQGFRLHVDDAGRLNVTGHDSHGAAYGLLEVSRLFGVSPWEWWADATPQKRASFELPAGYTDSQAPSVEYRGIFINDEDWGVMPWSSMTMEPGNPRGVIGPKTNEKIFQLLLRLRANYYWPAMHEVTEPFFLTPGNREMAARYGIYIGGSHCEPMASSTAVEWGRRGKGDYDYVNNSDCVLKFWEDRVRDIAGQEIVYTLGMRGVHDGAMNGAKTVDEQKAVLSRAIADQRALIARYVDADVTKVPQVFIPYKEVLDVYRAGLDVPDDVTLMWCDDNYGYIRHFPTPIEQARSGGNGIYYHVSYWGRPHDYLWLGTFSPYLLYQQMSEAYRHGIRKMWVLNVGDIKPAEYQTELFMDMAWDMDGVSGQGPREHLHKFLAREFGSRDADRLLPVIDEHYRLAFIRKPEFLGNTRTEERDRQRWNTVTDLPWSDDYVAARLAAYRGLSDTVEAVGREISAGRRDEYFQLVKYPVQAAAQMNRKMLTGQLARHGKADWAASRVAYDSIVALTETYNKGIANHGKWHGMMDMRPRKLSVFNPLAPVPQSDAPVVTLTRQIDVRTLGGDALVAHPGLGRAGYSVEIPRGAPATCSLGPAGADSVTVILSFLPNHPIVEGEGLKVAVSLDGSAPVVADYSTQGRSEEWKENVLNNRATRRFTLPCPQGRKPTLIITALTDGVILEEIEVEKISSEPI